jgi:hypothetical protein
MVRVSSVSKSFRTPMVVNRPACRQGRFGRFFGRAALVSSLVMGSAAVLPGCEK